MAPTPGNAFLLNTVGDKAASRLTKEPGKHIPTSAQTDAQIEARMQNIMMGHAYGQPAHHYAAREERQCAEVALLRTALPVSKNSGWGDHRVGGAYLRRKTWGTPIRQVLNLRDPHVKPKPTHCRKRPSRVTLRAR